MQPSKYIVGCLLAVVLFSCMLSCHKQASVPTYVNRLAQDTAFRLGKWYSISNGAGFNFTSNPLLDTIWFINDSLAGWTGFGGNPYVFWPTYFSGLYYIVYIAPDPLVHSKIDTVFHQCGTTITGDTFVIYWPTSNSSVFDEYYVKLKN